MSLHIDAEIVSAIFLGFLYLALRPKYKDGSDRERIFLLYIVSTVATIFFDVLARLISYLHYGKMATILSTTVYYMLLLMPVSCWLMYIMTFTFANNKEKYNRIIKMLHTPIILSLLLIVSNIGTHWLFTASPNGEFISGTYRWLLTTLYVIPGLASMLLVLAYKKIFDSKKLFAVLLLLPFIVIIGLAMQLRWPSLVTAIPANSIIAFAVYILIQNEETRKFTEEAEEEISKLKIEAAVDGMSGLLNKAATENLIESSLIKNEGKLCYLMIIDMDNLKTMNDRYGHEFGDIALKQISKTLKEHFRSSDIVGRIGGDEFCVFVADIPSTETMKKSTASLSNELHNTLDFNGNTIPFHCSIGGAFGIAGEATYEQLFRRADICLYKSKSAGKGSYTYDTIGEAQTID